MLLLPRACKGPSKVHDIGEDVGMLLHYLCVNQSFVTVYF